MSVMHAVVVVRMRMGMMLVLTVFVYVRGRSRSGVVVGLMRLMMGSRWRCRRRVGRGRRKIHSSLTVVRLRIECSSAGWVFVGVWMTGGRSGRNTSAWGADFHSIQRGS